MIGTCTAIAMALAIGSAPAAPEGVVAKKVRQDFAGVKDGELPRPAWRVTGFTWEVRGGKLVCEEPDKTFALLAAAPCGRRVSVEVSLKADRGVGAGWKVAGAVIHRDDGNYWHLAMVESPADLSGAPGQPPKRTWELIECLDGQWLANVQDDTKLPAWPPAKDGTWRYGATYRLKLELTAEGIRGSVADDAGQIVWQRGFAFPKDRAPESIVRSGRPGLDCGGLAVAFGDLAVTVQDVVPTPATQAGAAQKEFPSYNRPAMSDVGRKATGFFRVEQADGVWWLVDPNGHAFYAVGTDHARYEGHWCQKLGYAPYGRNMKRQFPNPDDWCRQTVSRLQEWGFNTVAAGGSRSLLHRGLVHTDFISFGAAFSGYSDITPKVHWTGFPNVFHPKWEAYCRKTAEQRCRDQKDDPWLLGYFLDNELEWYGKTYGEFGLVAEAWGKPADHSAKQALVGLLTERHKTVAALDAAWGAQYADFAALAAATAMPDPATQAARDDCYAYLELIAEKYFGAAARAVRAADPHHMILGSRFAGGVHDVVWKVAGRHLDVVSCNYYGQVDLKTGTATPTREALVRYYGLCKRPMMLTEWSHPALDSGLPCKHGAGQRFDTQAQRARAFGIYQTMLFSLPFMVGSDYFMWVDEPALGISDTFPEDTNYGLVNEQGVPYAALTAEAAKLNPRAMSIHGGRLTEVSVQIDAAAPAAVLRNSGKLDAKCLVEIWEDGRCRKLTVDLPSGHQGTVREPLLKGATGEAHWVVVRADPDGALSEADRSDNVAAAHVRLPLPPQKGPAKVRAIVSVGNPTDRTLENVMVRVPVADLWNMDRSSAAKVTRVGGGPRWGGPVTQQVNAATTGLELVFLVDKLPPWGGAAYEAVPQPGSAATKVEQAKRLSVPFEVDNGRLRLRKHEADGDLIDDVVLDGTPLGRVQALIQENVGQDLWLPANRLVSVTRFAGEVETVLDFQVEYAPAKAAEVKTAVDTTGKYAAPSKAPAAYRARYRLRIARGQPTFAVQCVSVTNADTRPWRLEAYFVYLPSHIGGSADGDDVPVPGVPDYYGIRSLWFDAKARAGYGAIAPPGIDAHFWLDAGGGQHPDVRRKVERVLQPGQTWTASDPCVWVFGVKGPGDQRPWNAIAQGLAARAEVSVKVWR